MKLQSYTITQGRDRAPARAQLKGIGFTDEDLKKPIIGIANTWIGTMPCNFLLRDLAVDVAQGIREAGGTPMEFNTIAISDGITMGTQGMKTSLISAKSWRTPLSWSPAAICSTAWSAWSPATRPSRAPRWPCFA